MPLTRRNRRSKKPGQWPTRRLMFWGGMGLFAGYLAFFLIFGRMGLISHLRMVEESKRLDAEITRAEAEIADLSRQVTALTADPHTIERIARERLGMVRAGETVFLFDEPVQADSAGPAAGRR